LSSPQSVLIPMRSKSTKRIRRSPSAFAIQGCCLRRSAGIELQPPRTLANTDFQQLGSHDGGVRVLDGHCGDRWMRRAPRPMDMDRSSTDAQAAFHDGGDKIPSKVCIRCRPHPASLREACDGTVSRVTMTPPMAVATGPSPRAGRAARPPCSRHPTVADEPIGVQAQDRCAGQRHLLGCLAPGGPPADGRPIAVHDRLAEPGMHLRLVGGRARGTGRGTAGSKVASTA